MSENTITKCRKDPKKCNLTSCKVEKDELYF